MTQDPDVMHGINYPKNTMVAIADDRDSRTRRTGARAAGFSDDDIYLLNGREAWEKIQQKKADRNIFERIFDNIQEMDAESGRNSPQDYLTALKDGALERYRAHPRRREPPARVRGAEELRCAQHQLPVACGDRGPARRQCQPSESTRLGTNEGRTLVRPCFLARPVFHPPPIRPRHRAGGRTPPRRREPRR